MSRTSIFEKRWLDLVFEGKNKTYGAYQLRLENPKTTMLAMLYAVLFIGGLSGIGFIFSSFGPGPSPVLTPEDTGKVIVVDRIAPPKPPGPVLPVEIPKSTPTKPQVDWRLNPTVAKPDAAVIEPVENPAPQPVETGTPTGSATSAAAPSGSESGTGSNQGLGDVLDSKPLVPGTLDKRPMFPGGMDRFYQRISRDFNKPEMFENRDIRVILSFVIEKDGSMNEIKVISRTDASLEKEAIRVLKSINKKWEPGVKDGKNVRTLFTLPLLIKPE